MNRLTFGVSMHEQIVLITLAACPWHLDQADAFASTEVVAAVFVVVVLFFVVVVVVTIFEVVVLVLDVVVVTFAATDAVVVEARVVVIWRFMTPDVHETG